MTNHRIFISHSKKDKAYAKHIANVLRSLSINVYFDEDDEILKKHCAKGSDLGVVRCIEDGLDGSTHLLGLITSNTKYSWWVPYEIGGAMGRKKECIHVIAGDVNELPEFIQAYKTITNQHDLLNWAASLTNKTPSELQDHLKQYKEYDAFTSALPALRSADQFKYY